MSHMSNKDIDERNDALEIQCRECGTWFTPNTQHKWGGFCSEACLELHDVEQVAYRKKEIERKEKEKFWTERVFEEWLPEHMENWRAIQRLRNGSPPLVTKQP